MNCIGCMLHSRNIQFFVLAYTLMLSKMSANGAKLLYIIRHGQALHNPRAEVAREAGCSMEEFVQWMRRDDALDAELTELGRSQARGIKMPKEDVDSIELVVSSPLSRAIETAELVLPPSAPINTGLNGESGHSERQLQRICCENFREVNGDLLNAKRREKKELIERFPHWNFNDIAETDELWTPTMEVLGDAAERGYQGLCWLLDRPENSILLVGHGGLLKYMMTIHPHIRLRDERKNTANSNGDTNVKPVDSRFENCELRRYKLCWEENQEGGSEKVTSCDPGGRLPIILTQID